jgi:quinol monooxygenase YgiN
LRDRSARRIFRAAAGRQPADAGCLSYVVATDPSDADALWVTEVWDSQASHQASLSLPGVQAAIAKGRPMIAGFSNRVETVPIGGYGLPKAAPQ